MENDLTNLRLKYDPETRRALNVDARAYLMIIAILDTMPYYTDTETFGHSSLTKVDLQYLTGLSNVAVYRKISHLEDVGYVDRNHKGKMRLTKSSFELLVGNETVNVIW